MKARQLINQGSYAPDTLKVIFQAFDEAWDSVAGNVGDNPLAIEAARLKLASIILSLPQHEIRDAEQVKNTALQIMAITNGSRSVNSSR